MPDEIAAESIRPDTPSADDALFGDAADRTVDTVPTQAEEQDDRGNSEQDSQGVADTDNKPDTEEETGEAEELKVVVSIKGGRAAIGVKKPASDPHIETFDGHDLPALAHEVVAVVERAKGKWEEMPKHPAYVKPDPPARRRNRRQQGAVQESTAETESEQTQQQTLNLF